MTVALFIPCIVDQFYPEIGESVVQIMETLGEDFDYPEAQTCCGLPFYNMGHWDSAVRPARHFVEVFEDFEAVITPSSSCASMVKHFFANLFSEDAEMLERVQSLASKTHELTSYLVHEKKRLDLGAEFAGSVACHRSCHLRELGARDEAETLLRNVKGAKFIELPRTDACCGFGGAFSVKFPVLSGAMGETKCDTFDQCKADCVVTTDAGCMLQINGILHRRNAPRRVWHIAELLANRIKIEAGV
ncbi:(Fe-S)-binding protein [Candidatus Sumerlaeota bacterium]|nr:(Fe-S)-binding protein [Candidatus Sumerlaeota bacterium]